MPYRLATPQYRIIKSRPRSKPSGAGSIWKGRRSQRSAVFAARRKRNGVCSQGEPNRSPAERVRFGKEEGVSVVQFSPRGGNGTVLTSSDVVVMPAGLEPGITSLRGLRPVRLDEGTIYGDPRRI